MADSTVVSETRVGPKQFDLDRCVHCGLCLNACPTYRELGLEMDSPRGRVYQMVQVSNGTPITPSYEEHIGLCLACRGCETACPSGVPYGRMVEDARAQIESQKQRGRIATLLRDFVFRRLLVSPRALTAAGTLLYLSEKMKLKGLVRIFGAGRLARSRSSLRRSTRPSSSAKSARPFRPKARSGTVWRSSRAALPTSPLRA